MHVVTAPLSPAQHVASQGARLAAAGLAAPDLQALLDATRPTAPQTGLGVGFGGIYATLDGNEVTHAIVEDAIAFAETFGCPVTHDRAMNLAILLAMGSHPLAAGWREAHGNAVDEARAEFLADRAAGDY